MTEAAVCCCLAIRKSSPTSQKNAGFDGSWVVSVTQVMDQNVKDPAWPKALKDDGLCGEKSRLCYDCC